MHNQSTYTALLVISLIIGVVCTAAPQYLILTDHMFLILWWAVMITSDLGVCGSQWCAWWSQNGSSDEGVGFDLVGLYIIVLVFYASATISIASVLCCCRNTPKSFSIGVTITILVTIAIGLFIGTHNYMLLLLIPGLDGPITSWSFIGSNPSYSIKYYGPLGWYMGIVFWVLCITTTVYSYKLHYTPIVSAPQEDVEMVPMTPQYHLPDDGNRPEESTQHGHIEKTDSGSDSSQVQHLITIQPACVDE